MIESFILLHTILYYFIYEHMISNLVIQEGILKYYTPLRIGRIDIKS